MQVLSIINICLGAIFLLCYFYQLVYILVAYCKKPDVLPDAKPSKIAILIAARNESKVIHNLLGSLDKQDYPKEFYQVYVVADNCTDNTAEIANNLGARVYERFNNVEKGKGYAVDYLIKSIERDLGEDFYDAYIIFDADNVVEPNYLTEINKTFAKGYDVVTSYRNASNYGASWRAAGQGMYFIRDSRILNLARMRLDTNTFVAGTGFLFSRELCKRYGGWPFHCLTEDGEFTMHNAVNDAKTGYCNSAMFYDEQATKVKDSWNQQLRWCKGGLQIFRKYLPQLIKGIFSRKCLSCFDMTMCLTPAYVLSITAVVINVVAFVILSILGNNVFHMLINMCWMGLAAYFGLLAFSLALTISEWKVLRGSAGKKILYIFTFPLFIFSFIPAAFVALFKKVEWKAISHGGEDSATKKD